MSIFLKQIDTICLDDVERFCQQGVAENVRLEYKQDFSSKGASKQIAKEVSALANTQGGVILLGVEEDDQHKPKSPLVGIPSKPDPAERIKSICLDAIYPPIIPEVQTCKIGSGGKVIVLVRAHASNETPHSIEGRTDVYVRPDQIAELVADALYAHLEREGLANRRKQSIMPLDEQGNGPANDGC